MPTMFMPRRLIYEKAVQPVMYRHTVTRMQGLKAREWAEPSKRPSAPSFVWLMNGVACSQILISDLPIQMVMLLLAAA